MKRTLIGVLLLVIFAITAIAAISVLCDDTERSRSMAAIPAPIVDAFEVVSGPQSIGMAKYKFWVVRHKATKSEFIFVECGGGTPVLEPLYLQSGEAAGLGFFTARR